MKNIVKNLVDQFYFSTERKILIIESDDWGSIRTINNSALSKLNGINKDVAKDTYTQLDSLETEEDLEHLFSTLNKIRDKNGSPAKFTFNTCMGNPDFEKIKASNFKNFHYLNFEETFERYSINSKNLLKLWNEGIENDFVKPQLHGREHLHSMIWLEELRSGNNELLKAFEQHSFGIPYKSYILNQKRRNLQAALDNFNLEGEISYHRSWLNDSASIFENTFGFKSKTFTPPAYILQKELIKEFKSLGVTHLQGIRLLYTPKQKKYGKILRFTGKKINKDLGSIVRNNFFEPSIYPNKDWYSETLNGISSSFKNNQPAIIGSHRLNYIGSLNRRNRTENLMTLESILKKAVSKWPEIEFMSSDEFIEKFEL